MKPQSQLSSPDLTPPTREDILRIMADLRQAVENDPTIDRKWMLEMSKYMFHIVGDWHEKVSVAHRQLEEKVDQLESQLRGIYIEHRERLNNQELSVNLCIKLANRVLDAKPQTPKREPQDVDRIAGKES